MRKVVCLVAVFILISSVCVVMTTSGSSENSISDKSSYLEKTSGDINVEKAKILTNLDTFNGYFTANQGQVEDDSVKYYIHGKGIWFLESSVIFDIQEPLKNNVPANVPKSKLPRSYEDAQTEIESRKGVILKLSFDGANDIIPEGRGLLSHESNFFYGNDPAEWCTKVPNYRVIVYNDIYNNIDLKYYDTSQGLKYDFIVHPGGEPSDIKLSYEGIQALYVDSFGDLGMRTALGNVVDSGMFVYQKVNNLETEIEGKFKLLGPNTYGFELYEDYDHDRDLIIDPLVYSTYLGSTSFDVGFEVAVDTSKNAYVTGYTGSNTFNGPTAGAYDITHNSGYDVFLAKLNSAGSALLYCTFIGGSGNEEGRDLVLDSSGNAYIGGITSSSNFPTTANAYDETYNSNQDGFILKLNPAGGGLSDLVYSSYIGGSNIDYLHALSLDSSNRIYVTGDTQSTADFPTTVGAYQTTHKLGILDAYFTKINPAAGGASDLVYSTYLGGSTAVSFPAQEMGYGIKADSSGNAYITGVTYSSDFPTTLGAYSTSLSGFSDGFITKINPAGGGTNDLLYSTYFGGSSSMQESVDIALDSSNNVLVVGRTTSNNFPTTGNAYDTSYNTGNGGDIFILKLDPAGNGAGDLKYSTFIGGTDDDWGSDIEVDNYGDVYVTGHTFWQTPPSDFPITNPTYDGTHNGQWDVVVIKLSTAISGKAGLIYSTFLGGGSGDWGYGIGIDADLHMYVTGYCGEPNFPNTTGAHDQTFNGGWQDAFLSKIEFNNLPHVLDINVSKESVYRTEWVYLYANGSDVEDIEADLTPTFEYKHNSDPNWLTSATGNLGTPAWFNNRWRVKLDFVITDKIGQYDFQVKFTDKGLLDSSWSKLLQGLNLLNNEPTLLDLKLSKSQAIQGETLHAWVNGTDIEDTEDNFNNIEFQYREPTWNEWNFTYVKPPYGGKYASNKWVIDFVIPFGAPFGDYDVRANITDSDNGGSGWLELIDALTIINEPPEFQNVGLSQNKVYRNHSVLLNSTCTDTETPEDQLVYSAEYKHLSDTNWFPLEGEYKTNRWQSQYNTNISDTLGDYFFRVKFEDNIGTSTDWQELSTPLTVWNNLPMISYALQDLEIGLNPVTKDLTEYGSDVEDPREELVWGVDEIRSYYYLESVKLVGTNKDILEITPKADVKGEEDIELTLTDNDDGTRIRNNITIHVDSTFIFEMPETTMLTPSPNSKHVVKTPPTLTWELYNPDAFEVNFTVYFDQNPTPTTVVASGLKVFSYNVAQELENNQTYYWYIEPSFGTIPASPFSFTVDWGYEIVNRVNLTSERSYVPLKQGESAKINLTVTNRGNVPDTIKLGFSVLKLKPHIKLNSSIQLPNGKSGTVVLIIDVPPNFEEGKYSINVKATSLGNTTKTDDVDIEVEVFSRFFVPVYNASISVSPVTIDIEQTESGNVTLTIENAGNLADEFYLDYIDVDDIGFSIIFIDDDGLVKIDPGKTTLVKVEITVPKGATEGIHKIILEAKSYRTLTDTDLSVNVKKKSTSSNGPGTDPVKKDEEDNTMIIIIIIVVIIIVVFLMLLFMVRKKKEQKYLKELEDEVEEERVDVMDGGAAPKAPTPTPTPTPSKAPSELPMAQPMPFEGKPPQVKVEPTPTPIPTPTPTPTPAVTPTPTPEPQLSAAPETAQLPPAQPTPTPTATPVEAKKVEK